MFRRFEEGVSPELEVESLPERARAGACRPQVVGAIELRRGRGEPSTLAVLQAYVANEGTGWDHAREELRRFFERVLTRHREAPPPGPPPALARWSSPRAPRCRPGVAEVIGTYLDLAALLGRRTADMHLALASQRR